MSLKMIKLYQPWGSPLTYDQQQVPDPQLPDHRTTHTYNPPPGSALQGHVLFYPGLLRNKSQLKGFLPSTTSLGGAIPGNESERRQGWGRWGNANRNVHYPAGPCLMHHYSPRFAGPCPKEMQKGPPLNSLVRREKIPTTTSFVISDHPPLCCVCIGGPHDPLCLCVNRESQEQEEEGVSLCRSELMLWTCAHRMDQRPLGQLAAGDFAEASEALEQGQGKSCPCADADGGVHYTTWDSLAQVLALSRGQSWLLWIN